MHMPCYFSPSQATGRKMGVAFSPLDHSTKPAWVPPKGEEDGPCYSTSGRKSTLPCVSMTRWQRGFITHRQESPGCLVSSLQYQPRGMFERIITACPGRGWGVFFLWCLSKVKQLLSKVIRLVRLTFSSPLDRRSWLLLGVFWSVPVRVSKCQLPWLFGFWGHPLVNSAFLSLLISVQNFQLHLVDGMGKAYLLHLPRNRSLSVLYFANICYFIDISK
jgi:hypothetical protein